MLRIFYIKCVIYHFTNSPCHCLPHLCLTSAFVVLLICLHPSSHFTNFKPLFQQKNLVAVHLCYMMVYHDIQCALCWKCQVVRGSRALAKFQCLQNASLKLHILKPYPLRSLGSLRQFNVELNPQ